MGPDKALATGHLVRWQRGAPAGPDSETAWCLWHSYSVSAAAGIEEHVHCVVHCKHKTCATQAGLPPRESSEGQLYKCGASDAFMQPDAHHCRRLC